MWSYFRDVTIRCWIGRIKDLNMKCWSCWSQTRQYPHDRGVGDDFQKRISFVQELGSTVGKWDLIEQASRQVKQKPVEQVRIWRKPSHLSFPKTFQTTSYLSSYPQVNIALAPQQGKLFVPQMETIMETKTNQVPMDPSTKQSLYPMLGSKRERKDCKSLRWGRVS